VISVSETDTCSVPMPFYVERATLNRSFQSQSPQNSSWHNTTDQYSCCGLRHINKKPNVAVDRWYFLTGLLLRFHFLTVFYCISYSTAASINLCLP